MELYFLQITKYPTNQPTYIVNLNVQRSILVCWGKFLHDKLLVIFLPFFVEIEWNFVYGLVFTYFQ